MNKRSIISWCIVPFLVLILAGCSGSGESSSPTISGIAAAGSTLSGTVYLKDSSIPARELSVPIAADGSFSFDLNGLTAPFILKATGTANGNNLTLYSFATAAGVANINPLSSLAVVLANGSDDLATLYNSPDPVKMHAIMDALPTAITSVQTALQPTLAKFGAATVNFISDPYAANHQGLDLLLDMAAISAGNGVVTIIDKTANKTIQIPLNSLTPGSIDIISAPIASAGSVLVWPTLPAVAPNETVNFTAVVIGSANQQVTWSVVEANGGAITNTGVYTAPATTGTYHVTATSAADATKSATATVTVREVSTLSIVPSEPGVFTVEATKLANVTAIDLTITYDASSLANPQVTPGAITSGAMMATNTSVPGRVRWALINTQPISGAGTLMTISFDLLGASHGRILSLSASLLDNQGRPLASTSLIAAPSVAIDTPPGASVSTPVQSTTGTAVLN